MVSIKSTVGSLSVTILPFFVILLSIVIVESICHTFLHSEIHPLANKHLAIESITAFFATLFIISLFLRNQQLAKDVKSKGFELSDVYEKNAFFRLLSEYSNDMIHLNDPTGKILYVNPVTDDLLGYGQDEIVNKSASNFTHPEDREKIREDMGQVVQGKKVPPREIRLLKNNGQYLDVEVKGFVINTEGDGKYIGAVLRDISGRKHNEQLLHAKKEWEKTFNTMTDYVSVHDKDFKIIEANQALCDFLGKSLEEIIGKFCYQIFHNMDEPYKNCPHKKTSEIRHPVSEVINDPNIGVPLQITCSPFFNDDDVFQGSVHIARALEEVDLQKGKVGEMIPICAACKNIRIKNNEWASPEDYFLKKHSCQFTHTICKECQRKLYPEYINS